MFIKSLFFLIFYYNIHQIRNNKNSTKKNDFSKNSLLLNYQFIGFDTFVSIIIVFFISETRKSFNKFEFLTVKELGSLVF